MATVHTVSGNVDSNHATMDAPVSDRFSRRLNINFLIKTPLGLLQLAATVINVICIGVMGDVVTVRHPGYSYWIINGYSYMVFFVMLSFMCLVITILILLTSVTSINTSSKLPQTTFFIAYHGLATIFYLCTSLAVLSEVSKLSSILFVRTGGQGYVEVRGQTVAAGSFGIIATGIYAALTGVAVYNYIKS